MTLTRFVRGMIYNYNQTLNASGGGCIEFIKPIYELFGYCVNGTSALQTPGGMATTSSTTYSISAASNASPISIVTTTTNSLSTGAWVTISGVTGNLAANGTWAITVTNGTTFTLQGSTGNGNYTGGGTIQTTPFNGPTNTWEGTPVLAVGSDGYTAAQVSMTYTGDAFFQATVNQPFTSASSSLTINSATNYQTTISSGSGGQTLPQTTINVASTVPASTIIASASNNVSLPTGTINVGSTTGFSSGGYIYVNTSEGTQIVTYTGTTSTTFTGCSGGIGSMITGGSVYITFAGSGTINVATGSGNQLVTYTGITATSFTGCSGGTGLMSTGGAVSNPIQLTTTAANSYNNLGPLNVSGVLGNTAANGQFGAGSTWTITTPSYGLANAFNFGTTVAFPSSGVSLPQGTINANSAAPWTTIASGSNGVSLPQSTINVAATATASTTIAALSNNVSLPTGTINVASNVGFPTSGTLNVFTTATTSIALGSSGVNLPQTVINVASTAGFPTSGTLTVVSGAGNQTVTYTNITSSSFTGCSGGTGSLTFGNSVTSAAPVTQTVTYTGVSGTTQFTGCLGGFGVMNTSNAVNNTGWFVNFPTAGQLFVNTANGAQLITYTNVSATTLTGCTGGSGSMTTGNSVYTAFSPASNYTSIASGSNGQSLPQTSISVASTAGFPSSGFLYVVTSNGYQTVNYTGTSGGNIFTGCTGGTGTMITGDPVVLCFAPTGTANVFSSVGVNIVTYTGVTATTFTGASGGSGTMSTGLAINSPTQITTTTPATLVTGQTIAISGSTGITGLNSSWVVTAVNSATNNNFSLNTSIFNGSYTGGGTVTDHQNVILNGSVPNGTWVSGGTQIAAQTSMVGKMLVMWKPNSGSSEDSMYIITSVISPTTVKINLNTGGTPDPTTSHPSFNQRSNINYRVVDMGAAYVAGNSVNTSYCILQLNPSTVGINTGQANSQCQLAAIGGTIDVILSPGGNWNGVAFPVTGNVQLDATSVFGAQYSPIYNLTPNTTQAITMAADPGFLLMNYFDLGSNPSNSSYLHVEIPIRLYPQANDTNPMVILHRGGQGSGTTFQFTTNAFRDFGEGFIMKCSDGNIRAHRSLSKSLGGDGSPMFGNQLTDLRLAFNTVKGTVQASDCVLALTGVTNQYALSRVRLRTIKFTNTPLPSYHRFGTAGGTQYINIQNGIAIIWDNTIIPQNLFYSV
jgi:hypothetical protein